MKVAICGAHRTGKTTLINALSDLALPIVQTQTSKVIVDCGLQPNGSYDFGTKLGVQHKILAHYQDVYKAAGDSFITDRSPIDALAYTLAEVNNATLDKYSSRLAQYTEMCISTMWQFDKVYVLPPVIPLVHAEGKGAITQSFINHIHALIMGLLVQHDIEFDMVPPYLTTVKHRVAFITEHF